MHPDCKRHGQPLLDPDRPARGCYACPRYQTTLPSGHLLEGDTFADLRAQLAALGYQGPSLPVIDWQGPTGGWVNAA